LNTYGDDFKAFFYVDGIVEDNAAPNLWSVLTRNGGNRFDTNSTWVKAPTTSLYYILNEYDATMVNLVVYNFVSTIQQQTFNLCCFLSNQTNWTIADTDNPTVVVYSNTANTCNSINVLFDNPSLPNFKNFLITVGEPSYTLNDIALKTCGDSYIRDIAVGNLPFDDTGKDVPFRTVTAAVVGCITFAIIVLSSALFLYVHYRDNAGVSTEP